MVLHKYDLLNDAVCLLLGKEPGFKATFRRREATSQGYRYHAQYPRNVAAHEGRETVDRARAGSQDKKRWLYGVMQSDATAEEANILVVPLVNT